MSNSKRTCCFIGHRNTRLDQRALIKLTSLLEDLIVLQNYNVFLFGSKSEFDVICHSIITELKSKYKHIRRIAYTCKSESAIMQNELEKYKNIYSNLLKKDVRLLDFDGEFEHKTKYTAGKASYIERNKAMIDDSDLCIIYYSADYQPDLGKSAHSAKSGTQIAYNYIESKRKPFMNVYEI